MERIVNPMSEPIHKGQSSFSGGEFAPSLWSRVDIAKYATGARKLLNFLVHPHGGVSNRPGTHMVAAAKNDNSKIRLIPFEFASDENYIIELGADSTAANSGYARFFYNDAQVKYGSTIVTLASLPWLEADLPNVRYAQSADVLFLVHPDYPPYQIERTNSTTFVLADYTFTNGPFQLSNSSTQTMALSVLTGSGTVTSSIAFFAAGMAGGQLQLVHQIQGQSMSQSMTASTISTSISCGGTWRIISHGTWIGKFTVDKSTDSGATWTTIRQFSSGSTTTAADFNVDTYGAEDMSNGALPFLVRVNYTKISTGTLNVDLTSDPYQDVAVANLVTYIDSTHMAITMQRASQSTAAVSNWAEGAWSDYRGWPQTVTFSQDRLVFASNYNNPQTIWMTQTGNYYDFFVNSPIVDSDSISINLPSQKLNQINGLTSLLRLLVFSTGAEWTVGADQSSILTPTTISTRLNSQTGSNGVQPVTIVNRAVYVQSRGAVVRDLGYDLFSDTFTGANLSILANHLFFNHNIVEMTYQQDPDSIVWCVRDDGKLLSMTYMREQEVLAWTQHDTNNGDDLFESIACIPATGYNEVWFSVNRDGQRYIERMQQRLSSTARENQFFLDSGVTFDVTNSTDSYAVLLMHFDASPFTDFKSNSITNSTMGSANVLCSHFDGADGATTYQDPFAGTCTFVGTAQLDTAQSKFGGASLLLDGNSDYVTYPDSASWNFGSGDFTIDFWCRFNVLPINGTYFCFCSQVTDANNFFNFSIYNNAGSYQLVYTSWISSSLTANIGSIVGSLSLNTWYHITLVVSAGVSYFYLNGINYPATGTNGTKGADFTGVLSIGSYSLAPQYFNGWIDEFRISKGVARWTSNFTPPLYAYSIAICDTAVTKFGAGSIYLNGQDNYLTVPDSADWNFGTGDFTIDAWVRFYSFGSGNQTICGQFQDANNQWNFYLRYDSPGVYRLYFYGVYASSVVADFDCAWVPTINTWYHIAVSRASGNVYLFINGVSQSVAGDGSGNLGDISSALSIGANNNYTFVNGWIDEFRISKGLARWTSDFTPQSSAYTGIGGPTKVITGLTHLEGRSVSTLADGNVQALQTVVGATITLTGVASLAHVGLPYNSDLETLNVELNMPDGTLQGRKSQISRVIIRLDNSRGGYVGPDFDHLYEILGDYNTSVKTSLFTGDVKIPLGGGYSDGGRFCFRQSEPLPVTILGVVPLVTPGQVTGLD